MSSDGEHNSGVTQKLRAAGHAIKDMVVSNKEDSQSDEHHIGGGYPSDRRGTNQSAVVEPSGASTATHFLSSIAGAATQLFPMGVGGTASGISQVQYGGTYPSQGEDIRKASNGRNDREFEAQYGPRDEGKLPREDGTLPPADATSSGPGTGVPSGGPRVLP